MPRIVGILLHQFGSGGGSLSAPTLVAVDNGNGTITVTISGSAVGSTNIVYMESSLLEGFTNRGSRVGDGTVTFAVGPGAYFLYIYSTFTGLSVVSLLYSLLVGIVSATLTHSPARIVRSLLVQLGIGTEPSTNKAWPAFTSREPAVPDSALTTYNTSGRVEGQTNTDNEVQEHYGVQVRARAAIPDDCYAKLRTTLDTFDKQVLLTTVTVESSVYLIYAISRSGGIIDMGNEVASSKRTIMAVNTFVSVVQLS